jgi:small subunit ribosomal protein S21
MIKVKVIDGNIEKALQIMKRKIKDTRLFVELRENEQYKKPSEVRRERKAKAKIREKYRTLETQNGKTS